MEVDSAFLLLLQSSLAPLHSSAPAYSLPFCGLLMSGIHSHLLPAAATPCHPGLHHASISHDGRMCTGGMGCNALTSMRHLIAKALCADCEGLNKRLA